MLSSMLSTKSVKSIFGTLGSHPAVTDKVQSARFACSATPSSFTLLEVTNGELVAYADTRLTFENAKINSAVKVKELAKVNNFDIRFYPLLNEKIESSFPQA